MRAKKSPGLVSSAGLIRLMTQAVMGTALGLGFTLTLVLTNPAVAELLKDGGSGAILVLTMVTTFAIGAALTGVVLIIAEDKQT